MAAQYLKLPEVTRRNTRAHYSTVERAHCA